MADNVSVVIPCLNVAATIGAQLDGLEGQDYGHSIEVLVVDNGSTDSTAAVVAPYLERNPTWRLIDASANPGVNGARNAGWRAASGELILFCDGDDVVKAQWVTGMTEAFASGGDVVGGSFDVESLNPPDVAGIRPKPVGLPVFYGYLPTVVGANFAVRREVLESLDGFDETFRSGGDETEFAWRAQLAGFTLSHAPTAEIAYRFRAGMKSYLRQRWNYAHGAVRLYLKFREHGMRRPKITHSVRLAGRSMAAVVRGPGHTRRRAIGQLYSLAGHVYWSVRHRTFYF